MKFVAIFTSVCLCPTQGKGTMTTYWLMGEKPINNNVQQASTMPTITQTPTVSAQYQDRGVPLAQPQPQAQVQPQPQQQHQEQSTQRPLHAGQSKIQGHQEQQLQNQQQSQPGQLKTREQNHSVPKKIEEPKNQQQQQNQNQNQKISCGSTRNAITGNGALAGRPVIASPSHGKAGGNTNSHNVLQQSHTQLYATGENLPNHNEGGPSAPLLLPAATSGPSTTPRV